MALATLDLKVVSLAVVQAQKRLEGLEKQAAKTEKRTKKLEKTTGRMDKTMSRVGKTIGSVARSMGLFIGGALLFTKVTSTMANFEQTMQTVRGVTGATGEEFLVLEKKARSMGATTRFSATQAAEGLLFLSRAGFSSQESIEALPATLHLAQAGAIDLGTAADHASNILKQFGLEARETTRVVDVMINTANSANTTVIQFAEGMKFAGPIAGALGRSIEETAAAIGVLGDAGIQGTLAGTGLRQIMLALVSPTAKAKKAIRELGLELEDVNPQTNSLVDIFKKLIALGERPDLASAIFGRRAVGAALIIARSTAKLRELEQANKDAEGTAKSLADKMDDTLVGAFKNLISGIEEGILKLGDKGLSGVFRSFLDIMVGTVRVMIGMEESVTRFRKESEVLAFVLKTLTFLLLGVLALKITVWFIAAAKGVFGLVAAMKALIVVIQAHPLIAMAALITGVGIAAVSMAKDLQVAENAVIRFNEEAKELNRELRAVEEGFSKVLKSGEITQQIAQLQKRNEVIKKGIDILSEQARADSAVGLQQALGFLPKGVRLPESIIRDRPTFKPQFDTEIASAASIENAERDFINTVKVVEITDLMELLRQQVRLTDDQINSLVDSMKKQITTTRGVITVTDKSKDNIKEAAENYTGLINQLLFEREMVGKSREEREKANTIRKAEIFLIESKNKSVATELKFIELLIDLTNKKKNADKALNKERQGFKDLDEYLDNLQLESALLQKSADEREVAVAVLEAENIAREAGIKNISGYTRLIENEIRFQQRLRGQVEVAEEIERIAGDVATEWGRALDDIAEGAVSAEQGVKNLLRVMLQMARQELLIKPFITGFSSFVGGLFDGGGSGGSGGVGLGVGTGGVSSDAFLQHGALLTEPTLLQSTRGGGVFKAAEAGPEWLVPDETMKLLRQGSQLSSRGGDTYNTRMTVITPNVDSFKASQDQTLRDWERRMRRARRR